jgi:biopolymer transport protein ExbD
MPKVKIARKSTWVDMTAFVDVAFLILSFFMLATKFKPEEPVEVKTPHSVSSKALPEKDAILISLDKSGGVFFQMDNPEMRQQLIENLNETRSLGLGPKEIKAFMNAPSVGVPFNQLKQLLSMDPEDARKVKQPGIPCADSLGGELYFWVRDALSVYSGRKVSLVIKGDNAAKYPSFKHVLNAFKRNEQNKFQLVTSPEEAPIGSPLWDTRNKQVKSGG